MTNTPERISSLAEAIMQMAEHDKGIIKSRLEELILQHCSAADAAKEEIRAADVAFVRSDEFHEQCKRFVDEMNFKATFNPPAPEGGWFCLHTGKRLTDP